MSLFGKRVSFTIHRSGWVLIAVLLALGYRDLGLEKGIIGGLLVALSLVIHEVAHVLVALFFAVPVHGIGIKFKGAYTFRKYASRRRHDVLIAAAGPFANLVLMFASFFVPRIGVWLAEWNCGIALINLLPLPGADGYRILKTIFWPEAAIYQPKLPEATADAV
jgi:Zn-dependent protease